MVVASRIAPRSDRADRDPERGYLIRYNRHPLRSNNFKVAEMYDCYKDGMSLETIAKLYKCTRQVVEDICKGFALRPEKRYVIEGLAKMYSVRRADIRVRG